MIPPANRFNLRLQCLLGLCAVCVIVMLTACGFTSLSAVSSDKGYILYEEGVVLDQENQLLWLAADSGKPMDWFAAQAYCKSLKHAGFSDWRLPSEEELLTLYKTIKVHRSKEIHFFSISGDNLWSSKEAVSKLNPDMAKSRAIVVNFSSGAYGGQALMAKKNRRESIDMPIWPSLRVLAVRKVSVDER